MRPYNCLHLCNTIQLAREKNEGGVINDLQQCRNNIKIRYVTVTDYTICVYDSKAIIYSPNILVRWADFASFIPRYWNSPRHSPISLFREESRAFSVAEAFHTVPIFVSTGSLYCWVDRGGVDLNIAQCFYTISAAWIEPQNPWSRVHRLNHSTTRSTMFLKGENKGFNKFIWNDRS